jgi:hypothetical protein
MDASKKTPALRLHFREPTIETNRPIPEGTVPVEGFGVQLVERLCGADAEFRRRTGPHFDPYRVTATGTGDPGRRAAACVRNDPMPITLRACNTRA